MVYEVRKAVKIPIIGMGGVASAEDVIEMMSGGERRSDWRGEPQKSLRLQGDYRRPAGGLWRSSALRGPDINRLHRGGFYGQGRNNALDFSGAMETYEFLNRFKDENHS